MSRIFSAGGGKQVSWMDKVGEEKEAPIGVDALDLKTLRKLAGFGEDGEKEDDAEESDEEDVKSEDAEKEEKSENPFAKKDKKDKGEDKEEGESEEHEEGESAEFEAGENEEISEGGAGAGSSAAVDQANAAIDQAKSALEEASVALQDAGASGDETVEVPVSVEDSSIPGDDALVEVELGGDVSDLGTGAGDDMDVSMDSEIGAEPCCEKCPQCGAPVGESKGEVGGMDDGANATEASGTLMAASSSKFHKIASLSPENKRKLKDYWVGSLGYDSEFVSMMLKDYNPKSGSKKY